MSSVKDVINSLRIEFTLWQGLLLNCKENPADCADIDDQWTLKDVLAHLTSWQEITLDRLIAARLNNSPDYPDWFPGVDPDTDEELDQVNEKIYQAFQGYSLGELVKTWEHRFSEILIVCQFLSEEELTEPNRYAWLNGYPLAAVLEGTLEHHREHRDSILSQKNLS